MKRDETIVIPLTVDMIDEQAKKAPNVDEHPEDSWIGYITIMARASSPNQPVQMISPPAAFFRREIRQVGPNLTEVPVWVCEGRAYRHGEIVE